MTPTATRLNARLDERRRWFHNQWFFKWHHIGGDRPVEIDTFDGGVAHFGGIDFSGSASDVYWDAITRGVRREINEQLSSVDQEVRNYNEATALRAVDECAGLLVSFARIIRREAVRKDRILRGDGVNFPPEADAGRWEGTDAAAIQAQADALKAALPFAAQPTGFGAQSLAFWNKNQGWLQMIGLVAAIVFGIVGVILAT